MSTNGDHGLLPSPGLQSSWPSDIIHARQDTDVGHPGSHYALARSLFAGYQHTSNLAYLMECIDIFRLLRNRASLDELEQMTLDLGDCLFAEHRRTGHIKPIEEMIAIHRHASTLGLSQRLNDLDCQHAKALLMRGEFTGDMTDVVRAKKMVDALEPNPKDPADDNYLVVLALYHRTISKTTSQGDLKTLRPLRDSMVERLVFRGASSARSDMLASCLTLCNVIYAVDGSLVEALGVVNIAKSALEQPITPSADLFDVLCSLSLLHITLGRRCSDINYMNAAKQWIDQALCLVQDSSINRGEAHHALGRWLLLSQYYFRIGHHSMFDDAANHFRQALDCCPRLHVNRHRYMSVFLVSVQLRVEHTGSMRALNEAIELFDAHRDLAATNPPLAVNASGVLLQRVMAGRLRTDSKQQLLERAVSVLQSALMNATDDSPYRITVFRALSNAYTQQSSLGLAVDISTHILAARSGVAMLVEDPEEQALCKVELARVLLHVAQSTSDLEALHESIVLLDDIAENSTSSLSGNEFNRADLTSLQAHSYLVRYKLLGAESDLVTANHLFDSSFSGVAYRIPRRLRRSLEWANAARFIDDRTLEMRAYHQAIDTLPQLTYLGTDIGTQIEAVQLVEGLASRAAALALNLNDPRGAIELLEQTRGVVWSQSLHVRARPEAIPPQYVEVFEQITGSLKAAEGPAERRRKAAELADLISQIRLVDGYKRFLLPRLYSELAACATFGAVIVAVPSDSFTDVVAIRDPSSAPIHLRLPALKLSRLQGLTAKLKSTSDRAVNSSLQEHRKMKMVGGPNAQQTLVNEYMSVLEELWTGLVHPVIAHLKIQVGLSTSVFSSELTCTLTFSRRVWMGMRLGHASGGVLQAPLQSYPCTLLASTEETVRIISQITWSHRIRPP
jgi:tetratricopeptide (TPR) repeat protein